MHRGSDMWATGKKGAAAFTSRFKVNRLTAQSIPEDTATKIQFNNVVYDNENEYDESTNYRFTAKEAGKYFIGANIAIQGLADGESLNVSVILNGGAAVIGSWFKVGGVGITSQRVADDISLNANDYLHVEVLRNVGGAKNTSTTYNCTFFGHRFA